MLRWREFHRAPNASTYKMKPNGSCFQYFDSDILMPDNVVFRLEEFIDDVRHGMAIPLEPQGLLFAEVSSSHNVLMVFFCVLILIISCIYIYKYTWNPHCMNVFFSRKLLNN